MSTLYLGPNEYAVEDDYNEGYPNVTFSSGEDDEFYLEITQRENNESTSWLVYNENETRQIRDYLSTLLKD